MNKLAALSFVLLAACGTESLDLVGDYTTNFDGTFTVTESTIDDGLGTYAVLNFDNDAGWVVVQNDSDNGFNPDLYSRFDWAEVGGQLYVCQVTFDSASEEDATDVAPADASDPANDGCGGFSWTAITPVEDGGDEE